MVGNKRIKVAVVALSLGIAALGFQLEASAKTSKKIAPAASTTLLDDQSIKGALANFARLLAAGDAAGLAQLWTEDGEYVDEEGVCTRGRKQIQERFTLVFTQDGKPRVQLAADKIKHLAPTVALVEGVVQRDEEGQTRPGSHFAMVMVKSDSGWLMSSAAERTVVSTSHYDYLRQFDWIIGDWSSSTDAATVHMKAEWLPNKNFILCKYETKKADGTVAVDIQLIGWDPIIEQARSWHFDNAGGFGQGVWSRVNNQWLCDTTGVEGDGSTTKSRNIISLTNADAFTWASVHRSVDGMAVGDAPALQVQRVR